MFDESEKGGLTAYIGCVELDSQFNQTQKEFAPINTHSRHAEDPRVFRANNKLFLLYNDLIENDFFEHRIMHMSEVDEDNFELKRIHKLDPKLQQVEKNWAPSEYVNKKGGSEIYFDYSVAPLKLLKLSTQSESSVEHITSTYNRNLDGLMWPGLWGGLRGGTPAQKVGDEYLAFFHSSFRDRNGIIWYCMGAYTFEDQPPFRITKISNYPILFEGIYGTPPMNTADPMKRVIFPSGFVVEERNGKEVIHLSCGENDASVKIITLDKNTLLRGMKKIQLKRKGI